MTLPTGLKFEDFGDTVRLGGAVFDNGKAVYIVWLPGKAPSTNLPTTYWYPTIEEWKALIKQTDNPTFTEYDDETRLVVKAIVRKNERQVDSNIMWETYRKAGFKCEYCGADDRPLTYDHYLAQAFGGVTSLENGRAACRPCNKKKGHMTIAEWEEEMKKWPSKQNV